MMTDLNGKDLPLTRRAVEAANQQERMLYARVVARLIEETGMAQVDLEESSGVTARSIRNLVQGKTVPQAEKLIALFRALGVDVDTDVDAAMSSYTKMLATAIDKIDPDFRDAAVTEAMGVLFDVVSAHPAFRGRVAKVTSIRHNVAPTTEDVDLGEVAGDSSIEHEKDTDDYDA